MIVMDPDDVRFGRDDAALELAIQTARTQRRFAAAEVERMRRHRSVVPWVFAAALAVAVALCATCALWVAR